MIRRSTEAESLYRRMLAVREQAFDPEHPLVAEALGCLGLFLVYAGRPAEAEPLLRRALDLRERTLGPDDPRVALSLGNLGRVYHATVLHGSAERTH